MSEANFPLPSAVEALVRTKWLTQIATRHRIGRRCVVAVTLLGTDLISGLAAVQGIGILTNAGFAMGLWAIPTLISGYAMLGLYAGVGPGPFERLRLRAQGVALLAAGDAVLVVILGEGIRVDFLFLTATCLLAVGYYGEVCTRAILVRYELWGGQVAFVGPDAASTRLARFLQEHPEFGLRPVGCVRTGLEDANQLPPFLPVLGDIAELENLAPQIEVLIFRSGTEGLLLSSVLSRRLRVKQLIILGNSRQFPSLWIRTRSIGGLIGIELRQHSRKFSLLIKRSIDLVITVPACIVAVPVIGLAVLAIKAIDRGPAFYWQERIGKNGRSIRVYKLRTMSSDAESRLHEYLESDPQALAEWQRFFKLSSDPRILPYIGTFLRRTSIDELPQLLNILLGQMSLVGPRPFPPYHVQSFDRDFRDVRCRVSPGLSGLWQVSARSNGDLDVQRDQDLFYILNWSIWLDLYVLLETPVAVITGRGAR